MMENGYKLLEESDFQLNPELIDGKMKERLSANLHLTYFNPGPLHSITFSIIIPWRWIREAYIKSHPSKYRNFRRRRKCS